MNVKSVVFLLIENPPEDLLVEKEKRQKRIELA
jgi:hypothetical protein